MPFFDFIMTTSNHRPYTYPENRIDIPSGTGRSGAVKYTDYAIGDFIKKAKTKPWFVEVGAGRPGMASSHQLWHH